MIVSDTTSLVDIHSHLVPGVDDGAKTVQAVLNAVERFTRLGVRRIVTTPHIQGSTTLQAHRLEERLEAVTVAFDRAAVAIRAEFPEVDFRRGHEVLIDVPEADLSDRRLRLDGTSFVLIEWPRLQVPPGTPRVVRWIRDQGYRPIIAHPERYGGMVNPVDVASRWRAAGAYLQVNFGSLVGRYGSEAESIAFRLLEAGLVDYLASDFHGHATLKIYQSEACSALEAREASEALDVLCRINPARVLDDQEPIPVPALSPERNLTTRIRGMIKREMA